MSTLCGVQPIEGAPAWRSDGDHHAASVIPARLSRDVSCRLEIANGLGDVARVEAGMAADRRLMELTEFVERREHSKVVATPVTFGERGGEQLMRALRDRRERPSRSVCEAGSEFVGHGSP